MKKKILLLVMIVLCGVILTGCKSELADNNTNSSQTTNESKKSDNSLVGSWEYESGGFVYTFNKDKSGTYDTAGTKMKFTYEVDGNKLSILYEGNTDPFETTYKIDGNTLTIKDSLDNDVKYIKK